MARCMAGQLFSAALMRLTATSVRHCGGITGNSPPSHFSPPALLFLPVFSYLPLQGLGFWQLVML